MAGALLSPDEPSEDDVFSFDFSFDEPDASLGAPDPSFDELVVSDGVDAVVSLDESLAAGRLSFL